MDVPVLGRNSARRSVVALTDARRGPLAGRRHHRRHETLSRRSFTSIIAVSAIIGWAGAGCDRSPTEPGIEADPDVRAYVVGDAAANLDGTGHFVISPDASATIEPVPVISASRARDFAAAYVKTFGVFLNPTWDGDRGAHINIGALAVASRVFPAETAYGPLPDVGCHPAYRHLFGSFYMMTLGIGGTQELRMAVSVQITDYGIDSSGALIDPPLSGQEFLADGIPVDNSNAVLLSPEQAVAIAARRTGAKVRDVPRMTLQGSDHSPNVALWRIALDGPVSLQRTDGSSVSTSTVYVGASVTPTLFVAAATQPTSVTMQCLTVDAANQTSGFKTITVAVLGGQPTRFERVR
jgi:hypothetical protein